MVSDLDGQSISPVQEIFVSETALFKLQCDIEHHVVERSKRLHHYPAFSGRHHKPISSDMDYHRQFRLLGRKMIEVSLLHKHWTKQSLVCHVMLFPGSHVVYAFPKYDVICHQKIKFMANLRIRRRCNAISWVQCGFWVPKFNHQCQSSDPSLVQWIECASLVHEIIDRYQRKGLCKIKMCTMSV